MLIQEGSSHAVKKETVLGLTCFVWGGGGVVEGGVREERAVIEVLSDEDEKKGRQRWAE